MKPLICIPMGDPAGIGPEILAATACDSTVYKTARLVGIGDRRVLQRAAQAMGVAPCLHDVDLALDDLRDDGLNFVDLANADPNAFEVGKPGPVNGRAAYEYVAATAKLALAGKVDALATTCLNKEALHMAHVPYIGHTEILAGIASVKNPLTMFQVCSLRVFFLTRHLSLKKACEAVTKDHLLTFIFQCSDALKTLGIAEPRLFVAGLNPHCSDNGLFGTEERDAITPAVLAARQAGCDVQGPFPADSVFHRALVNKSCDAVISLYHDQGHIATKMVDFERTISVTLGLPFLRTSVDHGTAYDIAGKGVASPVSLLEAVRLAALYAPFFKHSHKA